MRPVQYNSRRLDRTQRFRLTQVVTEDQFSVFLLGDRMQTRARRADVDHCAEIPGPPMFLGVHGIEGSLTCHQSPEHRRVLEEHEWPDPMSAVVGDVASRCIHHTGYEGVT